jgi:iron complex outermembrane recepter protein
MGCGGKDPRIARSACRVAAGKASSVDNGGQNYEAGLAVGGPIVDNELGFRLSAWVRHDAGYIDRIDYLDYQYSSHDNTPLDKDVASYDPNLPRPPAASVLNARLGVRLHGVEWAAFATNLTNSLPEIEREHDSPVDPLYRGMTIRPRTIGLQANVRY